MVRRFTLAIVMVLIVSSLAAPQGNPGQDKLMARRAAIVAAQGELLAFIKGLRLESGTSVQDFVTTRDTIRTQMEGFVKGAEIKEEKYEGGIAAVTLAIDVVKLNAVFGEKVDYDFPYVEVVGKGTSGSPRPVEPPKPPAHPTWCDRTVEAVGSGAQPSDPGLNEAQRTLAAERAAKLDAYRNLVEQIKGVRVDAASTVGDFIVRDDTIRSNVAAFVRGAKVVSTKTKAGGTVDVTIRIHLQPLAAFVW